MRGGNDVSSRAVFMSKSWIIKGFSLGVKALIWWLISLW